MENPNVEKVEIANLQLDSNTVSQKRKAILEIAFGITWCILSIVPPLYNTGFIFWMALVFGVSQIIRGSIAYFSPNN